MNLNIGILVFYCLEDIYKDIIMEPSTYQKYQTGYDAGYETYKNLYEKWPKLEYEHRDIERYLDEAVKNGITMKSTYAQLLLKDHDIQNRMLKYFGYSELIDALLYASSFGHDVSEEVRRLKAIRDEERIRYENMKYEEERRKRAKRRMYNSSSSSSSGSSSSSSSGIDNIFDTLERLANGGYTNKELLYAGERSAFDDLYDENFRENVKNDWGDFF